MSAIDSSPDLSLLIHRDLALTKLLNDARSGGLVNGVSLYNEIEKMIQGISLELKKLETDQGQLIKKNLDNVRAKIQYILTQFIQLDSANADSYKKLADSFAIHPATPPITASGSEPSQSPAVNLSQRNVFNFSDRFSSLNGQEQKCLLFFSVFPDGSAIETSVFIYWLVSLDLIDLSRSDGSGKAQVDKILTNLVGEGFITRIIRKNKVSNSFKLCAGIWDQILQTAKEEMWYPIVAVLQEANSFSISGNRLSDDLEIEADEIQVLLNTSKRNFVDDDTAMGSLSGMRHVRVAHLGIWHRDMDGYIVVRDSDFLKSLKNMKELRHLSLRGMSGIVELPSSVYKHGNLMVLDLRACHNLELLPQGIESLKQLTYLDLSECYLLSGIPKGIIRLTKLRVLKGFVINPVPDRSAKNKNTSCEFHELSKLWQLRKLSIRTRRMEFPTQKDLNTIDEMSRLKKLKIAWVGSSEDAKTDKSLQCFSHNLEKLEFQAAPKETSLKLFELIAEEENSLRKLYIAGGELDKLSSGEYCFHGVSQLRLRHLPSLHLSWSQCRRTFPDLIVLDMWKCANLNDFPCDENGVWRRYS